MYKQRLTQEQKDRLKRGDIKLLVSLLELSDAQVTKELKANKDDTRLLQGVALVVDKLLEVLKST